MINKIIFSFLSIFFTSLIYSQDLAEEMFKKNHKWGIEAAYSSMYVTNQQNSVNYEFVNSKASNFGLIYNVYQTGKINVSLGLVRTSRYYSSFWALQKEDGFSSDWNTSYNLGVFHEWNVPIQVEYIFPFKKGNNNFTGFIGFGPQFSFHGHVNGYGGTGLQDPDDPIGFLMIDDYDHFMSVGMNFTVGTNIQVGNAFLLRPFINYYYQPDNLYTLVVNTVGLKESPHTISRHRLTGNYLKFGMQIIPARNWFKKSKK